VPRAGPCGTARYHDPVAQPSFVPVADADRVRPSIPAPIPTKARANRPGELRSPTVPTGPGVGTTGPDQGFALTLAARLTPTLRLVAGEHAADVSRGLALLGSRRAALAGRAPSATDVAVAAGLFGFLDHAPEGLVAHRLVAFRGVAHSYDAERALVDGVPVVALTLTPAAASDTTAWAARLGLAPKEPT
jgi:hypothetical protein